MSSSSFNQIKLTRKELSEFLPDHRAVKAFENLFVSTEQTENNINEAGNANSKAVQADSTAQSALRQVRGGNVLLWLSM